ncbi:branched-chain amino acid ABC transporter substrate-binding protein [uncultured Ferrovibrio sp.]|jgi:branched-chain amino acid transport system substrate-binding protein|uniref:branched-chain amino acid ABC transporter substrate-binding protein n=1 Tax=uncultured Ferrovibrio sp. TaxID=1576913 RepID=UPI0026330010|nr:branched-chain amino acid ABC transporter substrate-binding protein [uncultured Ferrovibrio sp.]
MRKLSTGLAVIAAVGLFAGAASAQVKIALNGPITGQLASFGEQMKRGAEMAVADLNAKGGVNGQKVELILGDDQCDPKQAVAVANRAAQEKVAAVIGHFCSGSSIPASDVYKEENILQITPASTNPTFTDRGYKNVFRVCGRDDQQGIVAGDYILEKFKGKKVAILHDKTAYGKGLADETKKRLNSKGVQETMYEAITPGEKDYSALVSKMKAAGIELIYLGGYHPEGGLIIRQAKEQGMNAVLMGGDALVDKQFWAISGPAGEGTLMTFDADPRKNEAAKPLVDKFKAQGYDPEGYTLYTYAAVQIWAEAATQAKSFKTSDVEKAIRSGKFSTVLNEVSFDAKGDTTTPAYKVYVWKNGSYDYVN